MTIPIVYITTPENQDTSLIRMLSSGCPKGVQIKQVALYTTLIHLRKCTKQPVISASRLHLGAFQSQSQCSETRDQPNAVMEALRFYFQSPSCRPRLAYCKEVANSSHSHLVCEPFKTVSISCCWYFNIVCYCSVTSAKSFTNIDV